MISVKVALIIHEEALQDTGGASGVRDMGGLESALARPWGNFGGQEYYLTAEEKAAAILESILLNHPFVDGNKRTGYTLMLLTLNKHGLDLQVHDDEQYDFVVSVASGKLPFEEIVAWIRNAVAPK